MTAKQILDAFSEALMQDERILSSRERELLTSLLQNSKTVPTSSSEVQSAVTAAIAQSVGETVAQRAFSLLGSSIVEQILAGSAAVGAAAETAAILAQVGVPQPPGTAPQPPSRVPQPPGSVPQPPGSVPKPPSGVPQPPGAVPLPPSRVPQPPGSPRGFASLDAVARKATQTRDASNGGIGVLEAPLRAATQCVVLDEFLAPHELDELFTYVQQHEAEFQSSQVISPTGEPGVIDYDHRRSRVLMDLGKHHDLILDRIHGVLPAVLDQLGIEEFPITNVESQITASNDGDFFRAHSDDAQETIASRRITFVYFFHREPRPFEGGELRLYDSAGEERRGCQTIVPQQNQIVFFPCPVLHEITPVECRSQAFADSRFTLNGWLHN